MYFHDKGGKAMRLGIEGDFYHMIRTFMKNLKLTSYLMRTNI